MITSNPNHENEIQVLNNLVDTFAAALKTRLAHKYTIDKFIGWDDRTRYMEFEKRMLYCAFGNPGKNGRKNLIDTAAFAMFLWNILER